MTIRVLINGAYGKMGQLVSQTFSHHPDFTLVGKLGRQDNLTQAINATQPQIVIDFTTADVVFDNALAIIEEGISPVIGTTGLLPEQINLLQAKCADQKLGGIIAPNFSLGIILLIKAAQQMVKYFPDVEIIEMHQSEKRDHPSGTALHTAALLSSERSSKPSFLSKQSRETIPGARGALYHDIPIHAIRLPGLVAHEQILFGGSGETITLRHDAIDRKCFMPGIILACKAVLSLDTLVYGLEKII